MTKAIIIDDEPLARSLIKEYLLSFPQITVISECNDGFDGIKQINFLKPDLIFLDVQMPKLNGFEMIEVLDHFPAVIFTTAFDEFALKAFESNALDYLLKPFSIDRFEKAINKFLSIESAKNELNELKLNSLSEQPESSNRIVIKINGELKIVPVEEVIYIEAYDDYVRIYTKDHSFIKKKTMGFYESNLRSNEFVRIHRSYLINLSFLTKIIPSDKDNYKVILKNEKVLPVSRSGYGVLKEKIGLL